MRTKLRALEHRAVSGIWLLGEDFENIIISEKTYSWLWRNIYTICDNPRLVKMFWANSSQYFDFRLQSIIADYKDNKQEEKETREKERKRFLEFHYALGGLVLYKNHYKLLKYFFEYSQSEPPKYVLLPETMTDIFSWFEHFRNDFKNLDTPIDLKYYFPGLDNLGNKRQVNHWICSYISILFIRQYSLQQYYTFQNFTSQPNLPDNVIELNNWLDSVSYFEKCLEDILQNEVLISDLGFERIVKENNINFKKFISTLTENIKEKIGNEKLKASLSDIKIKQFYQQSNDIISNAFKAYEKIFIDGDTKNSDLKLTVNGASTLMSKSAFTEGDIPHLNFDTIFASSIANNKIMRQIPYSFLIAKTKSYVFNKSNIVEALDKLINGNDDILIITTNIIDYQLNELLKESPFKNYIIDIPSTERSIQNTLYVLRKSDLPSIEHKNLTIEEKKKFNFDKPINEELKLYASVIDINEEKNKHLKDEWKIENEPENLDLKVLLIISFLSVIHWKKDREVIQINISTEYNEVGIQNEINDVKPLIKREKSQQPTTAISNAGESDKTKNNEQK